MLKNRLYLFSRLTVSQALLHLNTLNVLSELFDKMREDTS